MMYHLHLEKHDVRAAISTVVKVLHDKGHKEFLKWLTAELELEQKNIGTVMQFLVDTMERTNG